MKILLMGDASNFHRALSLALRKMGHDVVVASNGSRWMDTARDIDISRHSGKLGGALLWAKIIANKKKFSGFDVVQIVNPVFVELKPVRVARLFDYLKSNNSRIFLTALGDDTPYIQLCDDPTALSYNEWRNHDGSPTPHLLASRPLHDAWLSDPLRAHCHYIYSRIDGAATALYEYHLACRRVLPPKIVAYTGIPIDAQAIAPAHGESVPDRLRLFIGLQRGRMTEKGSDRLLAAAKSVVERSRHSRPNLLLHPGHKRAPCDGFRTYCRQRRRGRLLPIYRRNRKPTHRQRPPRRRSPAQCPDRHSHPPRTLPRTFATKPRVCTEA